MSDSSYPNYLSMIQQRSSSSLPQNQSHTTQPLGQQPQSQLAASQQPHTSPQASAQQPVSQLAAGQQPQQYQQLFPQNFYPDQYQQYQQLLNSNGSAASSGQPQQLQQQQQQQQAVAAAQLQASQPYGSYYVGSNGQGAAAAAAAAGQAASSQAGSGAGADQYSHSRYPTATGAYGAGAAGAPYNSYSLYQQPGIGGSISQPQPQHYNAGGALGVTATPSTGAGVTAGTSSSTPVQGDTLNSSSNSTVGQYQPPGIRPRVTTTMWEDEKTLCYQVDANNVSVVRRADNNMINGTKLLNVAQMTRGRRDGILKSEKVRHVVKIGSMHLKGVWIPFERALAMAQREGIVDLLYPLFVRDIKRVIQTGVTPASSSGAVKPAPNGAPTAANASQGANLTSYYQQYASQYPQNGATAQNQSPQQVANAIAEPQQGQQQSPQQQQQQQSQVYGYQQPYYAPNQYYQPYQPNANYSSYGGQPVYPGYGYVNQVPVPQSKPQDEKKKEA